MTYHHAMSGATTSSSGAKVSIPVSMTTTPASSSWQQRLIAAAQAYYDALRRARELMPTWTPGDAQINAAKNILALAQRPVQEANLPKFRAEIQLAFAVAPKDASNAPASRATNVAAATSARAAVGSRLAELRELIVSSPTTAAPPTFVVTAPTVAIGPITSSKTTKSPAALPVATAPAVPPAVVVPDVAVPVTSAADQMVECTDGYVRDAIGLCVPGAPPPIAYPTTTTVPTTPTASGPLGVSYKWWGLGAAGVLVAGGLIAMSRRRVTPNRRR